MFEFSGSVLTYGEEYVPSAVALVSLCMALAVIGSFIGFVQQGGCRRTARDCSAGPHRLMNGTTGRIGPSLARYAWLLLACYVLLAVAYELVEAKSTSAGGYLDSYANVSGSLLYRTYQMTKFLAVPIITLVVAISRSKASFRIATAAILFLMFVSVLSGARTMPFLFLAAMVIAVDQFRWRISLKFVLLIGLLGSAASWIITESRATGVGLHVFAFNPAEQPISFWHIWWNSGGSIRAVLRTMEFTDKMPPLYGRSFLDALVYVVPNPVVTLVAPEWKAQSPGLWMLEQSPDVPIGEPVGMGYSLIGEAFLNFRLLGCLLFLLIGWLVAYEYFALLFRGDLFAGLQSVNLVVLLSLHLRNDSMAYARVLIWSAVLIWIAGYLRRCRIKLERVSLAGEKALVGPGDVPERHYSQPAGAPQLQHRIPFSPPRTDR